jgi:hypothetical protein
MMDRDAINARSAARRDRSFADWLGSPMVKLGISLIPPGDHHDALKLLLRSAFDAGDSCGFSSMVEELMRKAPGGVNV